ncbi:hypothetical protein [Streptomyces sp. NPDC012888]|uniref:hypothetical protein n=1 Tax=Streptomyces sp. NPDC012888 TaxID=3364855 RepID=UPI0036BF2A48
MWHTLRTPAGHWSEWGDVTRAAGATGPVTAVTLAGTGADAHLVVATDAGTRQYHAMRRANGTWEGFAELKGGLGAVTVSSVAGAAVDGEFQLGATTTTGKVLHTARRTDRTWSAAAPVTLTGADGTPSAVWLAGTL